MKRFIGISTLFVVFVIALCVGVSANAETHNLTDLGLEITIPSGYSVITKDTPENASVFIEYGINKSDIIEYFKANGVHLNALSPTANEEILVMSSNLNISNFDIYDKDSFDSLTSALVNTYEDNGFTVSNYETYHNLNSKFLKIYFSATDGTNYAYSLQYYTVYNNKAVYFTIRSYTGPISSTQENTLKSVVDSIEFAYKSTPKETSAFTYTDSETGVKFTVPENWEQLELSQEREYIDIKFISTTGSDVSITYGSADMWEKIPASTKEGYTRADVNNTIVTKSDIAVMLNVAADDISLVEYNGIEYYMLSIDLNISNLPSTLTQLAHFDNGWMYTFLFDGTRNSKEFKDFESLLNSVQLPGTSNVQNYTPKVSIANDSTSKSDSVVNNTNSTQTNSNTALLAFVFALVVGFIALFVGGKLISKSNTNKATSPVVSPEFNQKRFCRKCGESLPSDSEFCHKCGAKIIVQENENDV